MSRPFATIEDDGVALKVLVVGAGAMGHTWLGAVEAGSFPPAVRRLSEPARHVICPKCLGQLKEPSRRSCLIRQLCPVKPSKQGAESFEVTVRTRLVASGLDSNDLHAARQ